MTVWREPAGSVREAAERVRREHKAVATMLQRLICSECSTHGIIAYWPCDAVVLAQAALGTEAGTGVSNGAVELWTP